MKTTLAVAALTIGTSLCSSASVIFSSSAPNELTVTFQQTLLITVSPPVGPANRVVGDGNILIFEDAFSAPQSQVSVFPLAYVGSLPSSSTGTTEIDGITPDSADFGYFLGAQGFVIGTVDADDFVIRLENNIYTPSGGTGEISIGPGSFTITNWSGATPDQVVNQVNLGLAVSGNLATETVVTFVPEPSSSVFLALSALGMLGIRRRH